EQSQGEGASKLAAFRRMALKTTALVEKFQRFTHSLQSRPEPTDLNAIVRKVLAESADFLKQSKIGVNLELANDLPSVLTSTSDLQRLVELLIMESVSSIDSELGSIAIQTGILGQALFVRIADSGPAVAEEMLPHLFEPFSACRRGSDGVRLAVCEAMVRHMN